MGSLFISFILMISIISGLENNIRTNPEKGNSIFQSFQIFETNPSKNILPSVRAEDTLVLDDGTEFWLWHSNDYYSAQKFSTSVLCTLKSIILQTSDVWEECSLFVWNDSSGVPQSSINLISPIYFKDTVLNWQRVNLPTPIVINNDFWVGIFTSMYEGIRYDNTPNCHNRFATSYDKKDWLVYDYHRYGEFLIRPIVKLTGSRHDVSCTTIFSKRGFFLPNPAYDTVGIVVKNFGNVTEYNVPVYLRVKDTLGLVVFFDVQYIDSLKHNEIDTVFISWNYDKDGNYIIEGYPWISNDCIRDNDKQEVKSYIRTYPCKLYYHHVQYTMLGITDSIADKFIPPYYPCKIESVEFVYGAWNPETTYTYGMAAIILDDNAPGGFPGTEIATGTVLGLTQVFIGTLTVDFSQQNVVFDTGGFFVEWTDIPDSTTPPYGVNLLSDGITPPPVMMTWIRENGIWKHWWEHTDPLISIYVNYPNAVSEKRKGDKFHTALSINPSITKGKFKCFFSTSNDERIEIALYSVDGRKIKTLFSNYVKKGLHYFYPDITDLSQGIYFIRMKSNYLTEAKKIILLK